ncbi:MAG: hypothetical protein KC425_11030 [Anaerolineales bacterium]|nr:hypothetical protein [Anaerolineales bacterium]
MHANGEPNQSTNQPTHAWQTLWTTLPQPHAAAIGEEQRKRAQLLAVMLLALVGIGSLFLVYYTFVSELRALSQPDTWLVMAAMPLSLGLYFVNRTGRTKEAAVGFILLQIVVFTLGPFLPHGLNSLLYYALAPILLTAIFFSPRAVALAAALVVALTVGMTLVSSRVAWRFLADVLLFLVFASAIIIIFMRHYRQLEAIRRTRLEIANEKLQASEALLEERVEERTRELRAARDEAEAARVQAEEANQVKSQFLASMSHELRTPLNAILNFTEMTALGMLGDVNERQKDVLLKSLESGRYLLALINDVLDITKIQSGTLSLFIEEDVNLQQELEKVVTTAETLLQDKPVRFIREIDADLPPLTCDRRRVRQILLNLLSNAIKFTEEGSITLSARYVNGGLDFAVRDTGPGISAAQQAIIFEPFIQTDAGIKHAGGTGLGLPISRRLAEAHGGQLWVESAPGEGATFYVTLPLRPGGAVLAAGVAPDFSYEA